MKTSDTNLHSEDYGVVIPINATSYYYTYQPTYNANSGTISFTKTASSDAASTVTTESIVPTIDSDTKK